MHPEEFAKKPKLERVELMMRHGTVDYLGKGRPVLFAKAKEKPMEEDDEFELSFVEGLDSRTSLSQPGENDVNPQAQVDQAHLQAQFQSPLCVIVTSIKAHLIRILGIHGRVSRPKTMRDRAGPSWRHFEVSC